MVARWFSHRGVQVAVVTLGLVAMFIQWGKLARRPDGDFKLHWELGRRMVAGEYIYADDLDYPYPPFWGMAHAPLTVFSRHTAQIVAFPLFVGSLLLLIWSLNRLTDRPMPLARDVRFWVVVAAVALTSRYLIRDMVECGVNLFLVAMSYFALWLWTQRREWLGGLSLGLAMALKCTPTLFVVWFLWKRQWKMAFASVAAAAAFTLSPALVMGPKPFATTFHNWATRVLAGVQQSDPTMGVLGEEPFQNISLKQALARYLTAVPMRTGVGRPDHPLYFDFLDLPPHVASTVIKVILGSLLVFMAWQFRRRVTERDDIGLVWECAALSLLILLYSPITWGQHCVGMLPAFYLISRRAAASKLGGWLGRLLGTAKPDPHTNLEIRISDYDVEIPRLKAQLAFAEIEAPRANEERAATAPSFARWEIALLGLYVVTILLLNRGFVGTDLARLLVSYRLHTLGIVAVLAIAVMQRVRTATTVAEEGSDAQTVPALARAA